MSELGGPWSVVMASSLEGLAGKGGLRRPRVSRDECVWALVVGEIMQLMGIDSVSLQ